MDGMSYDPGENEVDVAFRLLAHRDRRQLLMTLLEVEPDDDIPLTEMRGVTDTDMSASHILLYHNHLPKLEACGVVEWDEEASTVRQGPRFDEIRPMVALVEEHWEELPNGYSELFSSPNRSST